MNISAFAERSVDYGLEEWIDGKYGQNELFKLKLITIYLTSELSQDLSIL